MSKTELRFNSLPLLLTDMEKKNWIIDSFPFFYKKNKYIVILIRYTTNIKPSKFAKASIEFIEEKDISKSIKGYIDFFEVHFHSTSEFCNFFNVIPGDANRKLFEDFSEIFKQFIPDSKQENHDNNIKTLMATRINDHNGNGIFCYEIKRNGKYDNGMPHKRSIENSNKAKLLNPALYEIVKNDTNLSFCFSPNPQDKKSDEEIIRIFSEPH